MAINRLVVFSLLLLLTLPLAQSQTVAEKEEEGVVAVKEHNPNKALLLSAVLPGAGQVYNHQAWKVPVIYAAIGTVGYFTYNNYTQMKYYKDEYLYRVAHNDATQYPDDADMVATPTANIYNLYEAYNKTFQLSVIVSVAVYGLNLLDAYVFGHLFDFQINDDISLNVIPTLNCGYPSLITDTPGFGVVPAATLTLRF
ncbi:MAG: hypothetical protein J6X58_03580 [Bacteroidales bacterium]|nr:hypothetical protein [Bacteroidales bacterium]